MAKVRISNVLEMLEKGITRKEIQAKLELSNQQMKALFSHDKLKGKRSKTPLDLEIIDDSDNQNPNESENDSVPEPENDSENYSENGPEDEGQDPESSN